MDLVLPEIGLLFWMTLSFLILLFILKKYAWGPILSSLKQREETIDGALKAAEEAKAQMAELQSKSDEEMKKARDERDAMLKEAKETGANIIAEAKNKAKDEADRILATSREAIQNEKNAAIAELKNQVAALSIEIAEKIVERELSSDEKQKALADSMVDEMNLN